jgi:hypothetical protein
VTFDFLRRAAAKSETQQFLKENPAMVTWLKQHKAVFGTLWNLVGVGLLLCGDSQCQKASMYFLVVGSVLTAAGVSDSDAQAKQRALAAKLGPLVPAIQAALPAAEEIAAVLSKEIRDSFAASAASPPQVGGRRASDPPAAEPAK